MLIQPLRGLSTVLLVLGTTAVGGRTQDVPAPPPDPRLEAFKTEAIADVERGEKLGQEIVDSLFTFGELGFQEVESSRYLKEIHRRAASCCRTASRASPRPGWRPGAAASR